MILDNGDSDDAGTWDEAEGASGDVDTGCIEQDASLYGTFAIEILSSLLRRNPGITTQNIDMA